MSSDWFIELKGGQCLRILMEIKQPTPLKIMRNLLMRIGSSWSGTKKTEKRVHGAMTLNRKPRFINQHHMHFVGTKKKNCYSIVSEELESSGIGEFG